MLALYSELPFILIGDSGQHDPEIYRQTVMEHPGRVLAVYIRNVSRKSKRIRQIEELAKVVAGAGSSLALAADSVAMAEHAARLGLVAPETISGVRSEKAAASEAQPRTNTYGIQRATPSQTADAVSQGDLRHLVETGSKPTPPSVIVEPKLHEPPKQQ